MPSSQNPFRLDQKAESSWLVRYSWRLPHRTLERILGLHQLAEIYDQLRCTAQPPCEEEVAATNMAARFSSRVLERFGVRWELSDRCLERIPSTGSTVIVANHPLGGLEGLIFFDLLSRIRPDFCLMANYLIQRIEELRAHVIAVDPFVDSSAPSRNRKNVQAYRQALQWLSDGGMLVIFPSGTVSHASTLCGSVMDPEWKTTVSRLASLRDTTVVPVYFEGQNSRLFQWAGLIDPRLRTAMLPREMLGKRGQTIRLRVGRPLSAHRLCTFDDPQLATDFLRVRTYALGATAAIGVAAGEPEQCRLVFETTRTVTQETTATVKANPYLLPEKVESVAQRGDCGQLREEVACLETEQLLLSKGAFDFYCAPASQIPGLLREIGRLRELAFRKAGEGTGKAIDLDQFDPDYMHLFAWNRDLNEVAGAYRIADTSELVRRRGLHGLYTHSLFQYSDEFLEQLDNALEMGRSFVAMEYQRSPEVLFGMWQAIGELVWRTPRIRTLFGTVSISRSYSNCSRQLMVEYLRRQVFRRDLASMVRPVHPYQDSEIAGLKSQHFDSLLTTEHLDEVLEELEGKNIPVLLRHYLRLGAEAIGFGVDPDFADAVDILIAVDVLRTEPRRIERFMGRSRAQEYLRLHGMETRLRTDGPDCSARLQAVPKDHSPKQSTASNR